MARPALITLLAIGVSTVLGTAGCTGTIGDGLVLLDSDETPPPPEVEPKDVPASPNVVVGTTSCVTLGAGETLWSVSPEGHAWLASAGQDAQMIRVVDPFDPGGELVEEIAIGALQQVNAWSQMDAAIVADDGLWQLDQLARIQLTPPAGVVTPPMMCGDPSVNGFLLTDGLLFERRADDMWWLWDPEVEGDGALGQLVSYEGECVSADNAMWLTSADGTLWQLQQAQVYRPVKFASLVGAAATASTLAILESDRLWLHDAVADAWQPWLFSGAVPAQMSAADGRVWMASGQQLLVYAAGSSPETAWSAVSHDMASAITAVHSHAGGAWLVSDSEACHVATGPMLRIEGVRPYARNIEFVYEIGVSADNGAAVTASVGEDPVDLTLDAMSGLYTGTARLDTTGWHDLIIATDGATRFVPIKRLPEVERSWAEDIEPIYQSQCTGSDCHGSATEEAPDLDTLEAWQINATQIRTRVVDVRTMPPPGARPDFGDEQVEIISQWLEGGMLP